MARIYVCGEAIVDFVQVPAGDSVAYQPLAGGSPFNITKAAAQAGSPASFLGALSTDLFGQMMLADLEAHGVDTTAVAIAWLLAHPAGIIPVLGTNSPERIAALGQALTVDMDRQSWFELYTLAQGHEVP